MIRCIEIELETFQRLEYISLFSLLLGYPTANFRPFLRGQPHSTDINHKV